MQRIQGFVADNLHEKLTLPRIAHVLHLSASHLTHQFKVSMGQSLHQYVLHHRLERARQLLLTSEHSIAEIAAFAGFTDHSHLTRSFKGHFGLTPHALRRAQRTSSDFHQNIQDNQW